MLTELCRSQLNDRNNDFPFAQRSTAAIDCNVAMTSQALELVTGETWTAHDVRAAGRAADGPTGSVLARRCYQAANLANGVDYQVLKERPTQDVRDLLDAGWFVVLFVQYGKLLDTAPDIVGSKSYRGAHALGIFDWYRTGAGRMVHDADPTCDGRARRNWTAPKGVQAVRFGILRDAGYAYTGSSTLSGHAVKP